MNEYMHILVNKRYSDNVTASRKATKQSLFSSFHKNMIVFVLIIMLNTQIVFADAATPNIHFLVSDSNNIVIGTVLKIDSNVTNMNAAATIKVESWLKTNHEKPADEIIVKGILQEDSPFLDITRHEKFLMFIFDKDKLSAPFSAIKISENGEIHPILVGLGDNQPKTIKEMAERIKTIMSNSYKETLFKQIEDENLDEKQRTFAAESLGFMRYKKSFKSLTSLAKKEDDKHSSSCRAAMWSLYRIDPNQSIPVFIDIATSSNKTTNVQTACHLFSLHPSKKQEDFDRLLYACKQWRLKDDTMSYFLIGATGSMKILSPDFKALLLEEIRSGKRSSKIASIAVAGNLKINEAIPLIEDILINDKDQDIQNSARIALNNFKM